MEILIRRKDNGQIVKFAFQDEEKYKRQLKTCQKWESEGKIEIIPQDINNFMETGVKI